MSNDLIEAKGARIQYFSLIEAMGGLLFDWLETNSTHERRRLWDALIWVYAKYTISPPHPPPEILFTEVKMLYLL